MVTFFEDRAEVVRVARCQVPAGRSRVRAGGLTLLVDDRSLACKAPPESGVDVVYGRVRRRVEHVASASAEELQALEYHLEELRTKLSVLERAVDGAGVESRRVVGMMEPWLKAVSVVPSRASDARAELESAYAAIDRATIEALDRQARLDVDKEQQSLEISRETARVAQARVKKPRFEAFAEIEVVAEKATEVVIEIVYRTPCALWRPEHLARLTRKGELDKGEITFTTFAAVWQITGESWVDVPCRFSTARPARSAAAPLLREDVLYSRKKSDAERKQIVVDAREQAISTAGLARGTRDVDEMPGVEDGGEAQWLTGQSPATLPSDGRPVRVPVGERTIACSVTRVAYPELGPATHLRATATLEGPGPLLAGPVTVGREREIVGASTIKFVGPGEPFELGFGLDDGLRVRRKVVDKRKTTQITGTQHVDRTVHVFVSNLGDQARALSVIERVPVSEVEDVEIHVESDTSPQPTRDADGIATFKVDVAPRATTEIVLHYRIEAGSNVVLPTL